MHKGVIVPDIVRETRVEAAPITQAVAAPNDVSVDVRQNLSPLVIKTERTRRASKSFTLKVPQQIQERRRP